MMAIRAKYKGKRDQATMMKDAGRSKAVSAIQHFDVGLLPADVNSDADFLVAVSSGTTCGWWRRGTCRGARSAGWVRTAQALWESTFFGQLLGQTMFTAQVTWQTR